MASYSLAIADVGVFGKEIESMEFNSYIDSGSRAKSADMGVTLTVKGRVSLDSKSDIIVGTLKATADWSLLKPNEDGVYKAVNAEFGHAGGKRTYELSDAFVLSFKELFTAEEGSFELVLGQKKDYVDGDSVLIG